MGNQPIEEQIYEEARLRVKAKKDFYGHLTAWETVKNNMEVIRHV